MTALSLTIAVIIVVSSLALAVAMALAMRLLAIDRAPILQRYIGRMANFFADLAIRRTGRQPELSRFGGPPETAEPQDRESVSSDAAAGKVISWHQMRPWLTLAKVRAHRAAHALFSPGEVVPPWREDPTALRWTAITLLAGGLAVLGILLWLAPNGLLYRRLAPQQDFIPQYLAAALGVSFILIGSAMAKLWWRNQIGQAADGLLFAAAVSVLFWSAISLLPDSYVLMDSLDYLSFDNTVYEALVETIPLRLPAALLPIGVSLILAAGTPFRTRQNDVWWSVAAAGAWLYGGGMTWWGSHILGAHTPVVAGLGVVSFSGAIALAFATMAAHGVGAENVVVAGISRWATQSRLRAVNVGIVVGFYAAFIRPLIFGSLHYSLLWEWLLGVSIILGFALLTGGQINKLRHAAERDQIWKDWRNHQLMDPAAIPHQDFNNLVMVQRTFVELGIKADLVSYLVAFLRDNRIPLDEIAAMVEPAVNYEERRLPRLAWWGVRRKTQERNVAERKELLRVWTESIQRMAPQLSSGYVIRESQRASQAAGPARNELVG